MSLQPLEDRIIVKPGEAEETTISGLVIPDTAKEKPQQGEVLAVGPGRRSEQSGEVIPLGISVGDTVVYSKYGGTEITIDGEDLLILTSRDVLATIPADDDVADKVEGRTAAASAARTWPPPQQGGRRRRPRATDRAGTPDCLRAASVVGSRRRRGEVSRS